MSSSGGSGLQEGKPQLVVIQAPAINLLNKHHNQVTQKYLCTTKGAYDSVWMAAIPSEGEELVLNQEAAGQAASVTEAELQLTW